MIETEIHENWRERIWPVKALITFCRLITRCQLSAVVPGRKLNVGTGEGQCQLVSFWNYDDMHKLKTKFDSSADHHETFFHLLLEESRESRIHNYELDGPRTLENLLNDIKSPSQGWVKIEILTVIAETGKAKLNNHSDNIQGSVWIIKVQIRPYSNQENRELAEEPKFIAGDLVVLHSPQFKNRILAIVQGWDPDYNNVDVDMDSESVEHQQCNLLVTVDWTPTSTATATATHCNNGGWAPREAILPGTCFSMAVVNNLLTAIRECQALSSLRNMNKSLQQIILKGKPTLEGTLRTQHSGTWPGGVPRTLWEVLQQQFNESQLRAIRAVLDGGGTDSSLCLLQGPPGTGKTRTILGLLAALLAGGGGRLKNGATKIVPGASLRHGGVQLPVSEGTRSHIQRCRVLICAPSNTAVDEIVYRIHTQGVLGGDGRRRGDLSVVRVGQPGGRAAAASLKHAAGLGHGLRSDVLDAVNQFSLDYLVQEKRKQLSSERRAPGGLRTLDLRRQLLERADVVCCTLSGAGSQPLLQAVMRLNGFRFDAVIIDEAAQAVEPSSLIPLKYNPRLVVLVGDPCQLPATVVSRTARDCNYDQSLFQRLVLCGYPVSMLEIQYRMHRHIADYPSRRFYQSRLVSAPDGRHDSHDQPYHLDPSGLFRPFLVHDVPSSKECVEGTSYVNRQEVLYVVALYAALLERHSSCLGPASVGIIAPYSGQRRHLHRAFREVFGRCDVEISTVDGFQGREKDVVIFSCVRAQGQRRGSIGFLKEWQRLNVSITRAKFALWIVCHTNTLSADPEWGNLLSFAKHRGHFFEGENILNKKLAIKSPIRVGLSPVTFKAPDSSGKRPFSGLSDLIVIEELPKKVKAAAVRPALALADFDTISNDEED